MEDNCKSLALQHDLFVQNMLKCLDTTIERDYVRTIRLVDELSHNINDGDDDKKSIKKTLEVLQEEFSKLNYKLKTSTRLFDEVKVEKKKIEIEKDTLKSQLDQMFNIIKKRDAPEITPGHPYYNHLDSEQLNENHNLDTDTLLSDLNYNHSENSSYVNVIKNYKHASMKKYSESNILNDANTKACEIKSMNINDGQIIATTTLTMDLGRINAKSILKTRQTPLHQISSYTSSNSTSIESLSSSESENETVTNSSTNIEKNHTFFQKIVVIPEDCGQCQKKIKFNNYMVKCVDCKIIAHLECKDLIPAMCTLNQYQIDALNCGIPPLIVHCISEIERRGLNTTGLYKISGSDKEVTILRDKFRKGVPNLHDVDIYVICSCLKDFIHAQKNSLISRNNWSNLVNALNKNTEVSKSLDQVVTELPSNKRSILAFLILHLKKIAISPKCNMDYDSLAIVLGPIILGFSSTGLNDLHKSESIFKVVIELLKLPQSFWINFVKADHTSSDELLHSTPTCNQPQTLESGSTHRFFSPSGLKRRILDSPKKYKLAKHIDFENKIE